MTASPNTQSLPPRRPIPPLQNGDRLTRAEFERRYNAMPGLNKAELIEGVVYMPSPVRYAHHSQPHGVLCVWLGYYVSKSPGLGLADNGTVRLDDDNEPQPDLALLLPKHIGGLATVDDDDYITGPPTLTCEIAASSVSMDLHQKLNAYRRNGVREYLVWRTEDQTIDWFILRNGQYAPLPVEEDMIKSEHFPGLWLNVPALLKMDLPGLFTTLDAGTATSEHAEFVRRLREG
jgi:hypothetical protein